MAASLGGTADVRADHFGEVVRPFAAKYCAGCHDAETMESDLDLTGYADAAGVARDRGVWRKVLQLVRDHEMPPAEHETQPTVEEREAFVAGLRSLFRAADAGRPRDPGPTLIRRLNRTEYDNTTRDLFHVGYRGSVLLPPDDRQHGFENIAESLSLSPVLMERYLEAAEQIVTRGLTHGDDHRPTVFVGLEQYMNRGTNVPYRVGLYTSQPLPFEFRLAAGGTYRLEIHGRPLLDADPPADVELRVDGKMVRRFEFAHEQGRGTQHTVPLTLSRGHRRLELVLRNPPAEQESKRRAFPTRVDFSNKEKLHGCQVFRVNLVGPTDEQPEGYRMIMATKAATPESRAEEILGRFAGRAFRRPATDEEVTQYVAVWAAAQDRGLAFDEAIGLALQAILVSPQFLFRIENDPQPDATTPHPVSDHQLASRLSYFLWSSMPDAELLELAERDELSPNLEAQVRRMLADWRASGFTENFVPQWLEINDLDRVSRTHRNFEPRLRADMRRETLRFGATMLRENRPITDFINGRFTFLNRRLARHYGLEAYYRERGIELPDQPLVRVSLPPQGERAGVLTHGSVLTMTAAPTRTSPVKRGVWILENILAKPPPPPPPDVPPFEETAVGERAKLGLRARLEVHRDHAQCAACHDRIDPIGFSLERFGNIGQLRSKYDRDQPGDNRGAVIDDRVELPGGRKFEGVAGLRSMLAERPDQFTRCLTEKVLVYALGRGLDEYDIPTVDDIAEVVAADDDRFRTLILEVVKSAPFRQRRGREGDTP